jgi:ribosomal protein S18 acetylase RimI-like enzyme
LTAIAPAGLLVVLWSSENLPLHWKVNLSIPLVLWLVVVILAVWVIIGQGLGLISVHSKVHEQWVAAYGQQIIAEILLHQYGTYSHIENLVVVPRFRRQGIATKMIHQLSQYANRPLYAQATTELMPLYVRLGFEVIGEDDIPERLRGLFGANRRSHAKQKIQDLMLR